ncbi:MAG: hypothetical protein HY465_05170 [Deltaproteobacteria bacterium]|nr:hypothetical protein [Deltaproteobacteria bacterium]
MERGTWVWKVMFGLFLVGGLALGLTSCSQDGGGDSESAATPTVIADVSQSSLSALASGGLSASANKDLDEEQADEEIGWEYEEEDRRQVGECPGGGTVTITFDDEVVIAEVIDFNHTFRADFSDCVVPACAGNKTINGSLLGSAQGSYDRDARSSSLELRQYTEGQCSGLDVDGLAVGLDITIAYDGAEQSFSGSLCTDPPGLPDGLITFDSPEDLARQVGSAICQ